MDGFSLTLYLKQLLMIIALIDPTVSPEDIASIELPKIESVSMDTLRAGECGCDCDKMTMAGHFYLDDGKPTIIIATPEDGNLAVMNVRLDALMLHELTHYVQYLQGKYKGIVKNGVLSLSEEDVAEINRLNETQAYENQNKYLMAYGIKPLNVEERVAWSSNVGSCGETKMAAKD